jgi:putative ABC transport system permease protein
VFWLIVNQGRTLGVGGTLLGLTGAFMTGRVVASQLYEVRASDPLILLSAAAMVVAITVLAVVVPARRASATSPARVLRLD